MEKHGRVSRAHDLGNLEIIAQDATNVDKGLRSDLHRRDVSHQKWTKIVSHKLDMKLNLQIWVICKWSEASDGASQYHGISFNMYVCTYIQIYLVRTTTKFLSIYEFWVLPTEKEIELIIRIVCRPANVVTPGFPSRLIWPKTVFPSLRKFFPSSHAARGWFPHLRKSQTWVSPPHHPIILHQSTAQTLKHSHYKSPNV